MRKEKGVYYKVLNTGEFETFATDSIITLEDDDGSSCPLFRLVEGKCWFDCVGGLDGKSTIAGDYEAWDNIEETEYSG